MVQHNMDDLSHLRDEESDGQTDRETPSYLMATMRSLKEDNERLMRADVEQAELNAVLLQFLSKIQKHMQQGPSNEKLQQSERLKTPSNAQKHGLAHNDAGKSSSKRKRQGTKRENQVETFPQSPLVERLFQQNEPGVAQNPIFLRRERGRNLRFL